eukprot:3188215-Amphidinium_carterae.2
MMRSICPKRVDGVVVNYNFDVRGSIAILNAGCGNSRLPAELVQDGYDNITSVDISSTVISKMQPILAQAEARCGAGVYYGAVSRAQPR